MTITIRTTHVRTKQRHRFISLNASDLPALLLYSAYRRVVAAKRADIVDAHRPIKRTASKPQTV